MPPRNRSTRDNRTASDALYAAKMPRVADFAFDARVARVFPDMIRRSVPGYETVIALLGVVGAHYAVADSTVYDLGCSLGAALLSIESRIKDRSVCFVGVDNSAPMLRDCRRNLRDAIDPTRLQLLHQDIRDTAIENASVVVLNFTLQFLPPDDRTTLLRNICKGLRRGGVAVISEKVCAAAATESLMQTLHGEFKTANGYSDLEIAQKRAALENTLTPESEAMHRARLRDAGFTRTDRWFQAFNFCSFLAHK